MKMNEKINLCEILKDCPKGTKFFSYMHGEVEFHSIDKSVSYPILVEAKTKAGYNRVKTFSKEGLFDDGFNGICALVPSLEQPDWSKWKCPKPKKPKFDPRTLKAFDKVLGRDAFSDKWRCAFMSHFDDEIKHYKYISTNGAFKWCIPYNDDTKHLVGTAEEAPELYRYWED